MTWYSYFLLNIPEAFSMLVLTFVLLGIPIKEKRKPIILFSFIFGGVAFILNLYMANSLKSLLLCITFFILVVVIFKMKIINSFVVVLCAYVLLVLNELIIIIFIVAIFSMDYAVILENPWKRILISLFGVTLPMLLLASVLKKLKMKVKVPFIFK